MNLRLRIFPALIIGAAGLLIVKVAELATRGPNLIMEPAPGTERMGQAADPLYTGSMAQPEEKKPPPAPPPPVGETVRLDAPATSPAERALLERLAARRQELDQRQRELETQESLLKVADKKLEARINDLRALEQKSAQAQPQQDADQTTLKNLVTMYESMKPREAARVFDKLDLKVLVSVANAINPRKMAEILAAMTPESATKLTVELAARNKRAAVAASPGMGLPSNELPAIEAPRKPSP